ncbi:MAG: neutral/alkaline non-lysosomal ceramidase N-terminal domain-containing protein [Limisphaerales bacterium]
MQLNKALGALCLLFSLASPTQAALRAGAAKADLTPSQWPVSMVGQFYDRGATNAFDKLHARAIVLDDGRTKLAIVVVDNCLVPREILDESKKLASLATGIPMNRMLISATHTHSAPATRDWPAVGIKATPSYVAEMTLGITESIIQANQKLRPAEVGSGMAHAPKEVFNRRWFVKAAGRIKDPFSGTNDVVRTNPPRGSGILVKPAGPTDPYCGFVSIRGRDGKPIALLANYSLHYVGGVPRGGVSADYFGVFAQMMEDRLGAGNKEFVAILSNGTSGDINNYNFVNPRPSKKPFEQMKVVAKYVADAVTAEHAKIEFQSGAPLAMQQQEIAVAYRKTTEEQVAQAKAALEPDPKGKGKHPWSKSYAKWMLTLSHRPSTEKVILQAIRIGDIGIASMPFEAFVEIGLDIRKASPLRTTFTIELANGHNGYLPTPKQTEWGGYETWTGSAWFQADTSVKITEALNGMIASLARR